MSDPSQPPPFTLPAKYTFRPLDPEAPPDLLAPYQAACLLAALDSPRTRKTPGSGSGQPCAASCRKSGCWSSRGAWPGWPLPKSKSGAAGEENTQSTTGPLITASGAERTANGGRDPWPRW